MSSSAISAPPILQQVSEGTNRKLSARNTLVQLLSLYTDPESHSAQRYRQTDGRHDDANSRSYCVKGKGKKVKEVYSC